MTPCFHCGRTTSGRAWLVGDRLICGRCAQQVRDVMTLAATLGISIYDLCLSVVE